jgi:hypothetical protein
MTAREALTVLSNPASIEIVPWTSSGFWTGYPKSFDGKFEPSERPVAVRRLKERSGPMKVRYHFKRDQSLKERLAEQARSLRDEAKKSPPGVARDLLLKRARGAEVTADMDALTSPGLRPPTDEAR